MRSFMDLVQRAFYDETEWNLDNSYSSLTSTAQALLFFTVPRGLCFNVSSLPSLNFASSYQLNNFGLVNGSLSYLYSSLPLPLDPSSESLDLRSTVGGYRRIRDYKTPNGQTHRGPNSLFFGRMYLPGARLEALFLHRLAPLQQLQVSCVSDTTLPNGGSVLALLQHDHGKYSTDYLFSTDSAMLGVRGLYNFGPDLEPTESPNGRFSAGAELYYGVRNKSGGISTGLRFATLPRHTGMPYTMTLTLNPLMGNVSSTYSVQAGRNVALSSQYDFNFYSYESDLRMGLEVWRHQAADEVDWARQLMQKRTQPEPAGVLKVRWDRAWGVGLLWEGRLSTLLFSAGVNLDLQRREQIFRTVGVEMRFSS